MLSCTLGSFFRLCSGVLLVSLLVLSTQAQASYVHHPKARSFIDDMVSQHGMDRQMLESAMTRAQHNERVIRLIRPPATPGTRSWENYRGRFMGQARIDGGVALWRRHADTLAEASRVYGVPPEIIVSILGVETHYGSYTGSFEAVSALATLAFDYPRREELFRRELENLFLLAQEQGRDPFSYRGSFAGALGYPQFLPSSIRSYAVDFNGDGKIDFDSNPIDAIGSIANYLAQHGWEPNGPIAIRARLPAGLDPAPFIEAGIEPSLDHFKLASAGILGHSQQLYPLPATLFDLPTPGKPTEYWLGYRNFYVITRYNRSSFYAMAVFELAEAIRKRKTGQ